ncbi:2-hydroxyacylsphingosine 1-beta-galactosyltransferase-like [Glandiceps talaboti]
MVDRGHNATMLVNHGMSVIQAKQIESDHSKFSFMKYQGSFTDEYIKEALRILTGGSLNGTTTMWDILGIVQRLSSDCDMLLQDDDMFKQLRSAKYDIIIANSVNMCHILIVQKLGLPFVSFSTQRFYPMMDSSLHHIPSYPSYVTAMYSGLPDKMNFLQRLKNLQHYVVSYFLFKFLLLAPYENLKAKYDIRPDATLHELLQTSEVALYCSDFALEFPRPLMPSIKYIGGLLAKPASTLDKLKITGFECGLATLRTCLCCEMWFTGFGGMTMTHVSVFKFLLLWMSLVHTSSCSKLLILPGYPLGSHYMIMSNVGQTMVDRGHNATMLVNHGMSVIQAKQIESDHSKFSFMKYQGSFTDEYIKEALRILTGGSLNGTTTMWDILGIVQRLSSDCDMLLQDDDMFKQLRSAKYDIIIANSVNMCHILIVQRLGLPFVSFSTQRFYPMMDSSLHHIPSYVTAMYSGLPDKMNFLQRLKNLQHYVVSYFLFKFLLLAPYENLKAKYDIRPDATLHELLQTSEVALYCSDFALEFPRPLMPSIKYIGGLLAKPASTLDKEFGDYVESAEHGIVVFALGSVANLASSMDVAEMFVRAFARLSQKVIMRYDGPPPPGVGSNTKLAKWLPQNDLLGHPKTKAFIGHGGMNGVYEAIYHGVPMVGMPIYGDNYDNLARLVDKGMCVTLDVKTLSQDKIYNAVSTIIQDKSYKENAMRLSAIHRDSPMTPSETAAFWIEHVMKHGGQHLRPASFQLNTFQYFLLDVIYRDMHLQRGVTADIIESMQKKTQVFRWFIDRRLDCHQMKPNNIPLYSHPFSCYERFDARAALSVNIAC